MVRVGYVRVSKENQDPSSQIKQLIDNGVTQENIFIDVDVSGLKEPSKRYSYKKLLDFISMGTTDEIILTEYSRLGRNAKESLYELLRLEKSGIKVKSLSANESMINDLPIELQPIVTSAMMLGADLERKHISERTKWGLENAIKKGKKLGRPEILIDWDKIESIKKQYNVSDNMARKLCGYKHTTFYNNKKERRKV